jgi:hypothetical protein
VYDLLISKAADLWAGTVPSEVNLTNEYLRGQVELIMELGVLHPYDALDSDIVKQNIARDIRRTVADNERPRLTFTRV